MKLEKNKFQYGVGKNPEKNYYKVIHVFKEDLDTHRKNLQEILKTEQFAAELGQQYTDPKKNTIYLGLGNKEKFVIRKIGKIYIKLGEQVAKWKKVGLEIQLEKSLTKVAPASIISYHIVNSLEIGATSLRTLSKAYQERSLDTGKITFTCKSEKLAEEVSHGIERGEKVSPYINSTRVIEHLPANHFTPEEFVAISKEIAKENKLKITVFDEDRLIKGKFGGILSVCRGSDKKPKMILLEYNPTGSKTSDKLAIVGKGLTFDAGGISLKPPGDMHEMKYDMCGAAATINAIGAIAALGIKTPVVAAIGVAENMPDAKATKPGDVYTAYNGTTVEVQNTDAEGRLVLGDVLSYVSEKYKPTHLVDLATLTGAIIIALGHEAAGVMSNSDDFVDMLEQASKTSEDRIWRLPAWEEYAEDLKSDIADIRNIPGGRAAGSLTAGQFLYKFVGSGIQWAHLDIAGTAWRAKGSGTQASGPTGYGVRLLVELAKILEKGKK
ncbi:MAG: leucyl aminopeptidase [Spirochaetota bacterium]